MSDSNGDVAKLVPVDPGSGSAKKKSLDSLTGMRFIAALMTFLFHATLLLNPIDYSWPAITPFADPTVKQWAAQVFSYSGFVGLTFFFVLSGFVITWSTRPGSSMKSYLRRRLVKVFPNHLVMWVVVMLLFAGGAVTVGVWLPNMLLLHAWFPSFDISQSMNVPSWSLSAELLFYLAFPLLIRPISRLSTRGLWIGAAATVAGLALYQVSITAFIPGPGPDSPVPLSDVQYWLAYLFPPARLFEFLFGMFLARIVLAGKWRIGPLLATVIMVLGYAATQFVPVQFALSLVQLVPIGIVVASFATADLKGTRTFLRSKPLVFLGQISFGFYMVQAVTVFYFRAAVGGATYSTPVAVLYLAGLFAASLLGGWLLFRFVETPMMNRWSRKRSKPVPPAEAPQPDSKPRDVGEELNAA